CSQRPLPDINLYDCTTWFRNNNEVRAAPYVSWADIGDRVRYRKNRGFGGATDQISVSGNAQSCSSKGLTGEKPRKITQIDTFSLTTLGFGFSVSPTTVSGSISISANGTVVTITNVVENTNCVQHSYGIQFAPTALGYTVSMQHTTTTTFEWGNGRTFTAVASDQTYFPFAVR
ncbi:MAG: hypothetical protein H7Y15_17900, partial [Pseudonocardia sp.]|nr:hypothetical protein [Pseudonocardia sp.]